MLVCLLNIQHKSLHESLSRLPKTSSRRSCYTTCIKSDVQLISILSAMIDDRPVHVICAMWFSSVLAKMPGHCLGTYQSK